MTSSSGGGNNGGNDESQNEDHFVLIENAPPSMDARMMMLMEQMAKTNENIAMLMANQAQSNTGTQVIIQSKEHDRNNLYDKFRKRGATEFYGNEGAIKADDWLEHIGDVFEIVTCDNKKKVVLATSMFREAANIWWKSVREPFKTMPNATVWEAFKKQFRRKYIPDHVRRKKQNEFLTLQQNQMTMAEYVHMFSQLSKYAEDLINTEEKKVDRFIGGLNPIYVEHVVAYKRPETFDDAVDWGFSAEEVGSMKRANECKRNPSYSGTGRSPKKQKGVVIGAPKCDTCGKGHPTERCWRNTGACIICGSMEHRAAACPRDRRGPRVPQQQPPQQPPRPALPAPPQRLALPAPLLRPQQQQQQQGRQG